MSGTGAAAPHNTGDRGWLLVLLTAFRAAPGSRARGTLASLPEGLTSPQLLTASRLTLGFPRTRIGFSGRTEK